VGGSAAGFKFQAEPSLARLPKRDRTALSVVRYPTSWAEVSRSCVRALLS